MIIHWLVILFSFQFDNISNRRAHFETTGPEIWNQTDGRIDAVTFSTGTGGTLAGKEIHLNLPLLSTCSNGWPVFVFIVLFQKISLPLPAPMEGILVLSYKSFGFWDPVMGCIPKKFNQRWPSKIVAWLEWK